MMAGLWGRLLTCGGLVTRLPRTQQAANLRARAELMQKIAECLKQPDWTQAEAASRCGVTQPRMNDLLRGRVSRFTLDALVNSRRR